MHVYIYIVCIYIYMYVCMYVYKVIYFRKVYLLFRSKLGKQARQVLDNKLSEHEISFSFSL